MKNNILKSYLIASLFAVSVSAQSIVPTPPELNLSSYILMDATTGKILAESNSNSQIEPASMTKVMTGYIVADQIEQGMISNDDNVLISRKAWKMEGSRMFIEVGKDGSIDHQHDWNQDDGEELNHRIDSQISFLQSFCMMPVNHREDPNDQQG